MMIETLEKLAIHTITTKPWSVETAIEKYAHAGVGGITVWYDALEGREAAVVGKQIRDAGLEIVSACRGGFFPALDQEERAKAIGGNLKSIETAEKLGAPMIVLVCGAAPGQSLQTSREQIREGIEAVLPTAEKAGIKLAIEPLHPMYADTRSAVNTLKQANDLCEAINSPYVGVALDVYHVWWDDMLEAEIKRCAALNALFAFHICDWKSPTEDLLLDRGLMGEGVIDIPKIRGWVEQSGFSGFNEVEIFSSNWWKNDQDEFLARIVDAYRTKC